MRWNDNRNMWASILMVAKRGCASVGKQLSMASAVAALGLTLSLGTGCFDSTVNPMPTVDFDGDGFLAGDDCDDEDAAINPDGIEAACMDGIDHNCDGDDGGEDCSEYTCDEACDGGLPDPPGWACNCFYDADGDGWGEGFGPGPDCDDTDASIHPEATEVCGDGIDQNCDGSDLVCEELSCSDICDGATPPPDFPIACNCFYDEDGDGYGDGFGPGPDCDDTDATIHPDAPEVCGDGIDQDCDGLDLICDVDEDGDGYTQVDDCDDSNAYVNPGMTEDCYDGVDNDCDGEIDETPAEGCIIMNGMRDVDDDGQNYG